LKVFFYIKKKKKEKWGGNRMIARDLLSRVASVLLSVGRFQCIETKFVRA